MSDSLQANNQLLPDTITYIRQGAEASVPVEETSGPSGWQEYLDYVVKGVKEEGPYALLAIATLIFGWIIISQIVKRLNRVMEKRSVDASLRPFLRGIISIGMKIMLLISVASMVGIKTTSFVAILGAASFAVGLALQGSLGNFAGGVLILIFKPYKVGDFIEAQGHSGTVSEIQIFNTILLTLDNKTVIIPNGPLSNGDIVNYTKQEIRRVDLVVGIGYECDIKRAKEIAMEVLLSNDKVLKDPAPAVGVGELGDSSVNLNVRPYAHSDHYWDVYSEVLEEVKYAFDREGISIPFPQRDIHIVSGEAS